ncbi:uncharacterized protein PgNI_00400 [Pyricularia grisea]|uniref:Uncharacterized protein n=1 Tax=Pyricularia grisea TaxID=148305 RepID=A0A6P8BI22_PYRGI|nr:uncharacterized protein PgNI_00400 [Pyricularia grisea]TLD16531.1 hypothetical protein PgNI_00400 [Pyricularia grisea]
MDDWKELAMQSNVTQVHSGSGSGLGSYGRLGSRAAASSSKLGFGSGGTPTVNHPPK